MFTEDLGLFFADFGVDATWGSLSTKVIIDAATEDLLGGRVLSTDYVLTLPAAEFPGIAKDAQITVGAVTYRVREVRLIDDGAVKELSATKL